MHGCAWIYQLYTECKGIDIGSNAIDGIIGNIVDFIAGCQCSGSSTKQKFGFIGTCIVGAHRRIHGSQRTI